MAAKRREISIIRTSGTIDKYLYDATTGFKHFGGELPFVQFLTLAW